MQHYVLNCDNFFRSTAIKICGQLLFIWWPVIIIYIDSNWNYDFYLLKYTIRRWNEFWKLLKNFGFLVTQTLTFLWQKLSMEFIVVSEIYIWLNFSTENNSMLTMYIGWPCMTVRYFKYDFVEDMVSLGMQEK